MPSPLTDVQKKRLQSLERTILHDKITVSFTIDERLESGRRLATFYSTTVTNKEGPGWSSEEVQIVNCLTSKQVVAAAYKDAMYRKILSRATVREELPGILASYDDDLARLLAPSDGDDDDS